MRSKLPMRTLLGLSLALAAGATVLRAQTVTVVNMVPKSMSGETGCDGEPSIAVNPANTLQMAGTAFTTNPAGGTLAPYYVSTDGGNTWTLNAVMPGGPMTSDVSLRFGTTSNVLYAGILRQDNTNLNILRTSGFTLSTPMTILVDRASDDQPFVDSRTIGGADRVYIGNNNFNGAGSQTASVDLSTNAATAAAPAGFTTTSVEKRTTASQDGPSVRAASAPDGKVYAAFLGWRSGTSTFVSDIVVVRDDAGGTGATKFASLLGSDGLAGVKVATGQNMTFNSQLGSDRVGSSLAIAVDPTNSSIVYVAWGEDGGSTTGASWTLHLRRSADGGATWSADLRTITAATNPALAVNSNGMAGFFYQKLSAGAWQNTAEFAPQGDTWASPTSIVLASLPDGSTTTCGQPTIGDYSGLIAVGADFYGVFSGDNTPNSAHFPHGVSYQRNVNWTSQQLLGTDGVTAVSTSIDPFFFHISGLGSTSTIAGVSVSPATATLSTGGTQTFTAAVTGTGSFSSAVNWTATGGTITAGGVYTAPATAGTYTVTATSAQDATKSGSATVTVNATAVAPSITTQPASTTVTAGQTATFTVAASGTAPLSYQWRKNGASIAGATGASYTTPATTTADSGSAFSVVVSNSAGSATSANANLTVNAGGTTTTTQLLGNPGFETGTASPWTMTTGVLDNGTSEPAHSGSWKAWLDGYGSAHTDSILQQVSIPSNAISASLSFWLHIDTAETTTTAANDTLAVQVRNSAGTVLSTLATYSNLNAAAGYTQKSFDVSAYKGQTVQVYLVGTENASLQTSFVVDDFALNVTTPTTTNTVTASITAPAANVTIASGTSQSFTGSATDSSSTATLSYAWTFGDGGTATGTSASHTFTNTGTAPVNYTVTFTATDNTGASGSATRVVTVNPAGGGTPTELMANGGFEVGTSPWTGTTGDIGAWTQEPPHAGTRNCWLLGNGTTATETIAQSVAIPASATKATLSFWIHIDTAETTTTTAYDTLAVQVRNSAGTVLGTLATYSNLNAAAGYVQKTFDLSAYKGQTVQVYFLGKEDASNQTSFVLDDVSLQVQ